MNWLYLIVGLLVGFFFDVVKYFYSLGYQQCFQNIQKISSAEKFKSEHKKEVKNEK